jgi:hypothetical protein
MTKRPGLEPCIRATTALIMALQEHGHTSEDIVDALTACAQCEAVINLARIRQEHESDADAG